MIFLKRRFVQDSLWQILGAVAFRGFFFLTSLFLARKMSIEEYGVWGYMLNYTTAISSIVATCFGIPLRRDLAKSVYSNVSYILFLSLLGCLLLSFVIQAFSLKFFFEDGIIDGWVLGGIILFCFSFISSSLYFLNYFYTGLFQFKLYNALSIPFGILLLAVVYFIRIPSVSNVLMAFCVVNTLNVVVLSVCIFFKKINTFKERGGKKQEFKVFLKSLLRTGVPAGLSSITGLPILVLLQHWIVKGTADFKLIAVVVLATQFTNLCNLVLNKLLSVISVYISKRLENKEKFVGNIVVKYGLMFTGGAFICFFVLSLILPFLINELKADYMQYRDELQLFCILYSINVSFWYINEMFHIIDKSWPSLYMNIAWAISVILIFWGYYYYYQQFSLNQYVYSITFARILPVLIGFYYMKKSLNYKISKTVYDN